MGEGERCGVRGGEDGNGEIRTYFMVRGGGCVLGVVGCSEVGYGYVYFFLDCVERAVYYIGEG